MSLQNKMTGIIMLDTSLKKERKLKAIMQQNIYSVVYFNHFGKSRSSQNIPSKSEMRKDTYVIP